MYQKPVITLFFISALSTFSFAQPVIQNTVLPDIGDVVKLTQADTLNVSEGAAGANQTWNFANWHIMSGTTPTQYRYISPVGTPYFANYPSATMVTKVEEDTVVYAYFREEANQYLLLGNQSIAFQQSWSDPDAQLKYPTNYNTSYSDNFAYTTDAGTGVVFYSKGSRNVKYDAYGTLTTPLGTFQNAMRIKGVSTQTDSASFSGIQIVNQSFLTTYGWLVAGHPGTVASVFYLYTITETRFPGFPPMIEVSPVTKSANYISSSTVGTFDLAQTLEGISDMTLGPVPATDELTLRFVAGNPQQDLQVRITDASGRLLQAQGIDAMGGENTVPLQVGQLPSGNYFLTLTDGHGVRTLNWVK